MLYSALSQNSLAVLVLSQKTQQKLKLTMRILDGAGLFRTCIFSESAHCK